MSVNDKPIFSFGIMSDCQYADIPDSDKVGFDRRYRLSKQKLLEAINFFNTQDLEFVVHLGDLIDQDIKSYDTVLPICETSKAHIWHVLGNHDFYGPGGESLGKPEQVTQRLGLVNPYYSKVLHEYRFIVLDTNEEGIIEFAEGSPEYQAGLRLIEQYEKQGRINAKPWNGKISSAQQSWLMSELAEASELSQKAIIFSHHGLFPPHRENMLNDKELLAELVKQKHLVAYINGHNHDGDYGQAEHLHCLTIHGMLDTGENAYATADVYTDRIEIKGYGREPSRTLMF